MHRDATRRPSLGARLRRARREGFVGRRAEVERFRRALDGDPDIAPVLLLHGPGGIGKTALLERLAQEADEAGRDVVRIDAPTLDPAGFVCDGQAPVLLVDAVDEAPDVVVWLRDVLLPRLPEGSVVVLAGRDRPAPEWQTDPGWRELVDSHRLGALDDDEAVRLLRGHDIADANEATLLRFAAGNPLALCLAADDAGHGVDWVPGRRVVRTLLDRMLVAAPDVTHDLALRICAHAQHTTVDLLRAFLDEDAASTTFAWLGEQPWVEPGAAGLHPDELVRRLVDSDHRWRDPQGYDDLHRTVWRHLGNRATEAHGDAVSPAVADLVHLQRYRHPERHESGALASLEQLVGLGPEPHDDLHADVLAIAGEVFGPEGRKDVEYWLDRQPEAFTVYGRADDCVPVAFMAVLQLDAPDPEVDAADPVVAAAWAHALRGGELRPGEQLEVARFVCPRPRSGHIACGDARMFRWYDTLFRRAGRLTASYIVLHDPDPCVTFMAGIDHALETQVTASADLTWGVFAHDWRQVPLAEHLERVLPPVGVVIDEMLVTRPLLDRGSFDDHVRQALRDWHDDDALAANPLAGSGADGLRSGLEAAIGSIAGDPRRAKAHRAVATTYLRGAITQEAAASRLGIPFSTYRRHLTKGTALVCDRMWSQHQGG